MIFAYLTKNVVFQFLLQAYVSIKRIISMLLQDEVDPSVVSNNKDTCKFYIYF